MNNEMHKNQDFLYNVREIAFANQCEIISKFNVIFTLNVFLQIFERLWHDFLGKCFLIGNPSFDQPGIN